MKPERGLNRFRLRLEWIWKEVWMDSESGLDEIVGIVGTLASNSHTPFQGVWGLAFGFFQGVLGDFFEFPATFCSFLSSKHQKYEQFKIEGL